jgi:hypothetical protein
MKIALVVCFFLLSSCTFVSLYNPKYDIAVEPILKTPLMKREFYELSNHIDNLFSKNENRESCELDISLKKTVMFSGITSSAFSVNKTLKLFCDYEIRCKNFKYSGQIMVDADFTALQDQSLSDYSAENKALSDATRRLSQRLHDEIKMEMIRSKNIKL